MDLENEQPSIAKLDQRLSDIQKAANNQKKQEELLQKIQQEYAVEAPELASEAEALQRLAAQARSRKDSDRNALREQLEELAADVENPQQASAQDKAIEEASIAAAESLARDAEQATQQLADLRDQVANRLAELAAEQAEVEAELASLADDLDKQTELSSPYFTQGSSRNRHGFE